jgi:hypothetical protein
MIRFIKMETNVFSKNQHKRKYSIDLIIKEIIYMLKNAISWKDYRDLWIMIIYIITLEFYLKRKFLRNIIDI